MPSRGSSVSTSNAVAAPATWPSPDARPSAACVLKEHLALEATAEQIEADLEVAYRTTLWDAGGV